MSQEDERVISVADLFDSSRRQEKLLEKLVEGITTLNVSLEKLGMRMHAVETAVREQPTSVPSGQPVASKPSEPRGLLVPPPGSGKPAAVVRLIPDEPLLSAEESAARQLEEEARKAREEVEADRRRHEELERLQRLEEERRRREEEAERARLEQLRRLEEERARKEALALKTKSIMNDLFAKTGSSLFPEEAEGGKSKSLFDD